MDERVRKAIEEGLSSIFPIEGIRRKLVLDQVIFDDSRFDPEDKEKLKATKVTRGTWGVPLKIRLSLVDKKTGKIIDRDTVRIGTLPQKTPHKTYVVGGTEYQVHKQQRLKHAVYAKMKKNGMFESIVSPANFPAFKINLDRKTGVFMLNVGSSNIPLISVLKGLGVSEDEIRQKWGDELFDRNKPRLQKYPPEKALRRLYQKIISDNVPEDIKNVRDGLKKYFDQRGGLDADVMRITVGKAYDKVSPEMILDASNKLLKVMRGDAPQDYRDEIFFKTFHDVDTVLKERLESIKRTVANRTKRSIDTSSKIKDMLRTYPISATIERTFTQTELSAAAETTNPLDLISEDTVITLKGKGGIQSNDAITAEAKNLHPSSLGLIDPVKTPQGSAGVNLHLAMASRIDNGDIKVRVYDLKKKKMVEISSSEYANKTVAFPGEFEKNKYGIWVPKRSKVKAVRGDRIVSVKPSEVDVLIPDPRLMFNPITNMIPFLNTDSGARAMFGANQSTQAVPLKYREPRMVQTVADNNGKVTFDDVIAQEFSTTSKADGTVEKVSSKEIVVKGNDGKRYVHKLYDHYPMSRDSFIHEEPIVKVGDKVKKGQILAENNFTKDKKLAIGQNLVVAYMPYRGYTYEDGVVITESGARKLTSEHVRAHKEDLREGDIVDRDKFRAYAPDKLTAENYAKLDKNGLIKPGSVVKPGEVIAAVLRKYTPSKADLEVGRLSSKYVKREYRPDPIVWNHEFPGVVTDANIVGGKINIFIKTEEPMKVGDKISNLHGGKGVVTKIIPDSEAPRRARDGKIIDIIVDPHTVPSRINIGQLYEISAGKIAEVTGEPYFVKNFADKDFKKDIEEKLKKLGLSVKEDVYDPVTGKTIPNINVGRQYILKLKHQVDKKLGVRTPDMPYDTNGIPVNGKRMDRLTFYAMVGHGAKKNLQEMATIKATDPSLTENNKFYWEKIRAGERFFPPPEPTFAYKKFESMLKVLGVNTRREGDKIRILPITDEDIKNASAGEIKRPGGFRAKDGKEIEGALFDPKITGGIDGSVSRWAHIELPERYPNPVFLNPIRQVLGLKEKDIISIIRGDMGLQGKTGPEAIAEALRKVNVEEELNKALAEFNKTRSASKREQLNKKIRYLKALKELKMSPVDAWTIKTIPVLPPKMRPVHMLPGGTRAVSDINFLYHDLLTLTKSAYDKAVREDTRKELRESIYKGIGAVMGLEYPLGGKDYKGVLDEIAGKRKKGGATESPKKAYFQRKVMYTPQELSARTVITADPSLDIDEVGYPEEIAWEQYEPFVTRRLVRNGYSIHEAMKAVKDRTPAARRMLEIELKERPVLINRAPSWHRFNIAAFKPKLVPGKDLKVPNLIVGPFFGGDFDGDAMQIHVPISDEAIREAKQMMPSRFLYKPGIGKLFYMPDGSALIGLNFLSKKGKQTDKKFNSLEDAEAAEKRGEIKVNDIVKIGGKTTTVGIEKINKILPKRFEGEITRSSLSDYLKDIAKKYPRDYARIVNDLNKLGDDYATLSGFSLGLDDLVDVHKEIYPRISKVRAKVNKIEETVKDPFQKDLRKIEEIVKLRNEIERDIKSLVRKKPNSFALMMDVSGKGNPAQIRQILAGGSVYEDATHRIVPELVEKPFFKGLDPYEFFIQQIGGRKGMVDRSDETSKPGEIGKQLLASNADRVITMKDCGTYDGIVADITTSKGVDMALDHTLAEGNSVAPRNTVITTDLIAQMKKAGIKKIKFRSPLKCMAPQGICQMCYGVDEYGKFPEIGQNVGVQDTQTIVERSSNLALKSWHTSGISESGGSIFERYRELVQIPKRIRNEATISTVDGKIEAIEKNPTGGFDVIIEGKRHVVPPNLPLLPNVKVGNTVKAGDPLSKGNLKPQDLLQYKGLDAAQQYMVDELHNILGDLGVKRKPIETIVSTMTNLSRINDPGDSDFAPYDYAPLTEVINFNREKYEKIPVEQAIGRVLAEKVGKYDKGTEITRDMILYFKSRRKHKVLVERRPIKAQPVMKPIMQLPLVKQEDWLAKMDFTKLRKTVTEGAAMAWVSDIHGYNPVSAFAYGAEFGKATKPGGY